MRKGLVLIFPVLLLAAVACTDREQAEIRDAAESTASRTQDETRADNTGVNERDRGATLTPPDQQENEGDLGVTQRVRQAIVADDNLSTTAHNVKIITVDGVVTLRGPVNTPEEKSTIELMAQKIDGVTSVDNQLEVVTR